MSRVQIIHGDMRDYQWPAADLVIADPPWTYRQKFVGGKKPSGFYRCLKTTDIAACLDEMPGRRLALWMTNPLLDEWVRLTADWSWGKIRTAGAWTKSKPNDTGHYGPGFHWSGCTEPVLIYTRDGSFNNRVSCRNAWIAPPGKHSEKPIEWQRHWIRRWVPLRGLVTDPFAGKGSVALAVLAAGGGRRYVGTEINARIHRLAEKRIHAASA